MTRTVEYRSLQIFGASKKIRSPGTQRDSDDTAYISCRTAKPRQWFAGKRIAYKISFFVFGFCCQVRIREAVLRLPTEAQAILSLARSFVRESVCILYIY